LSLTMKQWRLAKEMSQEDLARKCNVHRNTIASWEEDPESVSIKNARLISKALNEPVDVIFFSNSSTKRRNEILD